MGRSHTIMKCTAHNAEATAVCAHCGKALCPSCSRSVSGDRTGCSDGCAAALARADRATEIIIHKSTMSAKASAFACYLCGALFVISGIAAFITYEGRMFLPLFCGGLGIALIVCGFWYSKAAKQQDFGT